MMNDRIQDLLRNIPSVTDLLSTSQVQEMLACHPRQMVVGCVRDAVDELRANITNDTGGQCGMVHVEG
ncbi:MAG TPA: hypothetical protein ENL03_02960, partial [Phycisphaerae bacterium]|nr:hypothetical protein [Phycisphaerae bacterium]